MAWNPIIYSNTILMLTKWSRAPMLPRYGIPVDDTDTAIPRYAVSQKHQYGNTANIYVFKNKKWCREGNEKKGKKNQPGHLAHKAQHPNPPHPGFVCPKEPDTNHQKAHSRRKGASQWSTSHRRQRLTSTTICNQIRWQRAKIQRRQHGLSRQQAGGDDEEVVPRVRSAPPTSGRRTTTSDHLFPSFFPPLTLKVRRQQHRAVSRIPYISCTGTTVGWRIGVSQHSTTEIYE